MCAMAIRMTLKTISGIRTTPFALLAGLLGSLAITAQADTNADEQLLHGIYAQGGQTLYCDTPFEPGDRTRIDRIYAERPMLQHLGCSNARSCQTNPAFVAARDDLHQMFPIERQSDMDRRGTLFGELRAGAATSERCGYRLAFQTFEPPEAARGAVARAMMYMHVQHGLPLVGPYEMFQRWNEASPPDAAEQARNERIEALQGNRNPFIDNPASMRNVPPPSLF